jgi:hypothetical protein
MTVREFMVHYAEGKRRTNPAYWAERLVLNLANSTFEFHTVVIDDVRKMVEKQVLADWAGYKNVTHLHVEWEKSILEPEHDNKRLKADADFIVRRRA